MQQSSIPVIPSLIRIGGWSLYPTAFLARLPVSMSIVSVLTLLTLVRGSYVQAGIAAACVGLGSAAMAPLMGVAADRVGQRIVLVVTATINIAALIGMNLLVLAGAQISVIYGCAVLIGMSGPQVGPMMRARWIALFTAEDLADSDMHRHVQAVMSYESISDELNYVLGPVLVGVLAAGVGPYAPLYTAAGVSLLTTFYFAFHASAAVVSGTSATKTLSAPASELLRGRVMLPVLGMVCIGMFFGSSLAALNVYMGTFGLEASTGVIYGVMGTGSAIFALLILALSPKFTLPARWIVAALVMTGASAMMPLAADIWVMSAVLFLAGTGVGPALVTISTIGNDVAPKGRSTTTFTLLAAGVILGQAVANAFTSSVAVAQGYQAGFLVTVAVSAALALIALVFSWRYRDGVH